MRDRPSAGVEAAGNSGATQSLLPLSSTARHRLAVVALLLLGAGVVATEYAFRPPAYRAMAIVDAPAAATYHDPGLGTGDASKDRLAQVTRLAHLRQEQSLLIAAMRQIADRTPIARASRLRRKVPRLTIRRTAESNIVRLVVVAGSPSEAADLANAAARILVRQEQATWQEDLNRSLKAGSISPELMDAGAAIRVMSQAKRAPLQSKRLHVASEYVGIGLLCLAAAGVGILAIDWWVFRRKTTGDSALADLSLAVVGTVRVPPIDLDDPLGVAASPSTFIVEPQLWSYLESRASEHNLRSLPRKFVIAIAPCNSNHYYDSPGAAQCRSAAVYFSRMAAGRGHRVLLIDANVVVLSEQPSGAASLPKLPGFAEAIAGRAIAGNWLLEDEETPNLTALSAGRTPVAEACLSDESMTRFLAGCRDFADWIVIAGGPVIRSDAAPSMWSGSNDWADAVLLINESGFVASDALAEAAATLLAAEIPVIGQITWVELNSEADPVATPSGASAANPAGE